MRRLLPLLSLTLLTCGRPPGTATVDFRRAKVPGAAGGTWVAKFNGDTITDAELSALFAQMNPNARSRFQTVEQRKDFLDGLVRFELLSEEAIREGLANDPAVVDAAKRVLVSLLLKSELEERGTITDAQVQKYYSEHQSDYVKPAMTRLSHLFFAKEHRAEAEAALQKARALEPLDYASFSKLAREADEDPRTKQLDGDLRFLSDEELKEQYGAELVPAALGLKKVGDVAPALVETAKGFHVVKLQGRQIALNLSVEQAKPSIKAILLNETKQERFRALLERLKKQSDYQVNDRALAALVVDPKAPAVEPRTPQPGFIPAPQPPPATR